MLDRYTILMILSAVGKDDLEPLIYKNSKYIESAMLNSIKKARYVVYCTRRHLSSTMTCCYVIARKIERSRFSTRLRQRLLHGETSVWECAPPGSMAKPERLRFTILDDLILLREVSRQNPYEESDRWKTVAERVVNATQKNFSLRCVKEHVDHLLKIWTREGRAHLKKWVSTCRFILIN